MNQLSDKIKKTREGRNLNRSQIATILGISSQLYGQYEDGKRMPKMPFFVKWKEKFNQDLIEANVSQETKDITHPETFAGQSLNNLTESNKVLAEANRTLAEANKTLAEANHVISKNHDELIQLTKMIVANSQALPKSPAVAFGPEGNVVSPGFAAVTPSGTQMTTGRSKGKH